MHKIPTIEEIYNFYHKETTFISKGFYPRPIKNFDKILTFETTNLLKKFQIFLEKNNNLINWKLYIKSLAIFYKARFNLKLLGSLAANKIYRQYLEYINVKNDLSENDIIIEIKNSIQFLTFYLKENKITFKEYFNIDNNIIPIYIKHIYAGSISQYFYSCLSFETLIKLFYQTSDDIFFEFFKQSKNEFIDCLMKKRSSILKFNKIKNIIDSFQKKFN